MNDERIARILRKLEQVRRRRLSCFGSERHGFRLRAPAGADAVRSFEEREGVVLPDAYRRFLLEAGNGGAGPYYGLWPLEECRTPSERDAWFDDDDPVPPDYVARPCPLVPGIPIRDDWMKRLGIGCAERFRGTIGLCEQGCSYASLLIVSGEARGRVVNVDYDGQAPRFADDPDFLAWYERWLDEILWGYDSSWFGIGMAGREEDFLAASLDRTRPHQRVRALAAMHRLPGLSGRTQEALVELAADEDPHVRGAAAGVVARFGVEIAMDAARRLLDDEDDGVRRAAWQALGRADEHDAAALHRALKSGTEQDRIDAVWHAGKLPDVAARVELLSAALGDTSDRVRLLAINGLGRTGSERARAALEAHAREETDDGLRLPLNRALEGLRGRAE